ncbi:MAG TPA: glucuronate isomerase [Terriglobales bacterium]|nr:glucuronate isomerase [Terriglobales bacterium]
MGFIDENFLLRTKTSRHLYREYAADQPILDYHCHLSAKEIAENYRFRDLTEIWLEGDHYKWRAMRANGVPERYCTGDAKPYEKFLAWARTVPHTLRNPLYHWTHLELKRYFGIDSLLDATTAEDIWKRANAQLASDELTTQGILEKFRVVAVCTTDDPVHTLEYHERMQRSGTTTAVFPTFRPDRAMKVDDPKAFAQWTEHLGASANVHIVRFSHFLDALRRRHQDFHDCGCRLSDHGLAYCYTDFCPETEAAAIFEKVRNGTQPTPVEVTKFGSFLMVFFGHLDAEKGWTKQLHLGAYRNASTRAVRTLGRDTGFDAIGDWPQAESLARYLDRLDQDNRLPKLIVYNVNPTDNYVFATIVGSFQDGSIAGKMQFGSGWWFLDQKEGMEWQMNALSNCGLLSRFIGMVTDSRSFMSHPRHEYFRRVLCNLLGNEIEAGELPDDDELIGSMIRNICYDNAARLLELPIPQQTRVALTSTR